MYPTTWRGNASSLAKRLDDRSVLNTYKRRMNRIISSFDGRWVRATRGLRGSCCGLLRILALGLGLTVSLQCGARGAPTYAVYGSKMTACFIGLQLT